LHAIAFCAIIKLSHTKEIIMSYFTYETKDSTEVLEEFEWDNVWWEHTENKTARRILYIGDSISCGTMRRVTRLSREEILCDNFATSKALDNPYFKPSIELCLRQQSKCDAILFNNGLHGFHLSDAEYEKHYEDMLLFLLKAEKPLYVVLTTNDNINEKRGDAVKRRNLIAQRLAAKHGLPIIDLYTVSVNHPEHYSDDGVHLNSNGYDLLAECILTKLG